VNSVRAWLLKRGSSKRLRRLGGETISRGRLEMTRYLTLQDRQIFESSKLTERPK
jgi:hypothetical protein